MDIERHLAETRNFRDIGGARTEHGSVVRSGRLYRMGKLYRLSGEEQQFLEHLDFTDIIDLRSESERAAQPDTELQHARNHHIDLSAGRLGLEHVTDLYRKAASDPDSVDAVRYIIDSYRDLPEACAQQVREVIELIAENADPRLLIHCAGGKDRTGFLTAVLLGAVGVPDEAIIADYMRSVRPREHTQEVLQRYLARFREYGISIPPEVALPFLTVDESSILAVVETVKEAYGGFYGYVHERVGCSDGTIAELRDWLVL